VLLDRLHFRDRFFLHLDDVFDFGLYDLLDLGLDDVFLFRGLDAGGLAGARLFGRREQTLDRPRRHLLLHAVLPDRMGGLELAARSHLLELHGRQGTVLVAINVTVPFGGHGDAWLRSFVKALTSWRATSPTSPPPSPQAAPGYVSVP